MDLETLKSEIYHFNEDELFYQKYYYARQQQYSLDEFLSKLDMNDILRRHLLILKKKETIPLMFEDSYFFGPDGNNSIVASKHNCFSPPLMHEHTFFEVAYVYDGKCKQTICDQELELITGDLIIIPPGIKHMISVFDNSVIINCLIKKSTLHNIFFSFLNKPNILSAFFLNNIYSENGNSYVIFHTGSDPDIRQRFLYIYWESLNKNMYYDQLMNNTLLIIFGLLIRNYEKSTELPTFTQKTDVQRFALLQYIQENFATVTLEKVAERFHYTPEYTSQLIRKTTGRKFTDILQKIRIEKAQIMLQDTNLSVSNIAHEVGYENTEHFIRIFKKNLHMTPTEYRRIGYQPI